MNTPEFHKDADGDIAVSIRSSGERDQTAKIEDVTAAITTLAVLADLEVTVTEKTTGLTPPESVG